MQISQGALTKSIYQNKRIEKIAHFTEKKAHGYLVHKTQSIEGNDHVKSVA